MKRIPSLLFSALLVATVLGVLFPVAALAGELEQAKAREALAAALSARKAPLSTKTIPSYGGCKCGASCSCLAGECGDPACPSLTTTAKVLDYEQAYKLALAEKKPLLIWMNQDVPAGRGWSQYLNTRKDDYYDGSPIVGLVVGCVQNGQLTVCGPVLRGKPTLEKVKVALDACSTPAAAAAPALPAFRPMMAPMFFGGGFGGGGGGRGGSC